MKEVSISTDKEKTPVDLAKICAQAGESKKATDISVIDVSSIIGIAEYFVICSGSNSRQVDAIVESVLRQARSFSFRPINIEGTRQSEWVLIDFGSVVVHVFLSSAREFYKIERLFKDAPKLGWNSLDTATG